MLRTIISLDENDKHWLDHYSEQNKMAMTEVVRVAIKNYRQTVETHPYSELEKLLNKTSGTWRHGDGLKFQIKLRAEWDRRP